MNYPSYKKLQEFSGILFVILCGFITNAIYKASNGFTFPNLDEMLWYYRSRFFWDKMLEFDFSGLIQSAQPGITVYWFTGFMMKFIDFDFNTITNAIAEKQKEGIDFNWINANNFEVYRSYAEISFLFNVPFLLLTAIFFICFYYLIKKLGFNKKIAFFATLFISNNTYMSYWNTPSDKMLYIFMTLSFLTILVYLAKKGKKYLILSAILGGLAVLSKLSALFIIPFYFLIFIFYSWPINKKKIWLIVKDYAAWIIIFIITCILFLPSIITNPNEVYDLFFSTNYVFEGDYKAFGYFNRLLDYGKLMMFVVSMMPAMTLLLIVYFVLKIKKGYRELFDSLPRKHIQTITAYIILFAFIVTIISHNHDTRFLSPSFAMTSVLSATGLYVFIESIKKKTKGLKFTYIIAALVLILSQFISFVSNEEFIKKIANKYFGL